MMNYLDVDVLFMCIYEFCYFYFECVDCYLKDCMVIMCEFFWFVGCDDELYYLVNMVMDCECFLVYCEFMVGEKDVYFGGCFGIY